MKTMKAILFTIAMTISVCTGAVEYGKPYQPVYSTAGYTVQPMQQVSSFQSGSSLMRSGSAYSSTITPVAGRPRRVKSDGTGSYDGEINGDKIWDGEEWITIPNGTTKDEGGVTYIWNGTAWVAQSHQADPDQPIGSVLILLLFALLNVGYIAYSVSGRRFRKK